MTKLDLFNDALDMVGQKPIDSVDDVSVRAEVCSRNFDQALGEILRVHEWSFVKQRATLTETTAPLFGWDHAFTLPADFLTLVKLNGVDVANEPGDFYELEFGVLLTDSETAEIQYIAMPT